MESLQAALGQSYMGFGTPCAQLVAPVVPEAQVLTITAVELHNLSFPLIPVFQGPAPAVSGIDVCNVTVSLRHDGADDTVYVTTWLPLKDWNGRYQAAGGGGLAAGLGEVMLGAQVAHGYAVSSTDGGLSLNNTIDPQSGTWALKSDGTPNDDLTLNLAWRSIHDMAVVSKDVIKQFYGTAPSYSYWQGCSQGGRQGYAAAAKYPHDFDGILAVAPAIQIADFVPADSWPPVVMHDSETPPSCVFDEYQKAIIAECDGLDGVVDGFISTPESLESCTFDPESLVGNTIACKEGCKERIPLGLGWVTVPCKRTIDLTITTAHAHVISEILSGPHTADGERLWYGMAPGADFDGVAGVVLKDDWTYEAAPFEVSYAWLKYLAMQKPDFDMAKMTRKEYVTAHEQSKTRLSPRWGNQELDLTSFKQSGGKLLTWFGLADQLIPPLGMIRYREGIEEQFGGADAVNEWYRLFFAPGAGHCFGGAGPLPLDPLGALVSWVEEGKVPEVLAAATKTGDGVEITRDLCSFPKKLTYKEGDVNIASSFSCE